MPTANFNKETKELIVTYPRMEAFYQMSSMVASGDMTSEELNDAWDIHD